MEENGNKKMFELNYNVFLGKYLNFENENIKTKLAQSKITNW